MPDPILIMATPRSGSSMVAGIFHDHGVWVGTCREPTRWNPKGFFENVPIKNVITGRAEGTWHKAIVHKGRLAERLPGFRAVVERVIRDDGYSQGPWLWKGSALYWPAWFEWERPKWVCVLRDPVATARSCEHSGMLAATDTEANIRLHHREMHRLRDQYGAVHVDSEAVANGDDRTIGAAITACGLDYDPAVVREFVNPGLWHFPSFS